MLPLPQTAMLDHSDGLPERLSGYRHSAVSTQASIGLTQPLLQRGKTAGGVLNPKEIRRNTQKYPIKDPYQRPQAKTPINTQKYAETPYQYTEIPKQKHPKQKHPKQKPCSASYVRYHGKVRKS